MSDKQFVFIVYVSDIDASVKFYSDLLGLKTSFESPRYAAVELAPEVFLALWTGRKEVLKDTAIRASELCLNLGGGEKDILATYNSWLNKGVPIAEHPYQDVFGTTFVALDLDGNRIRVAPID